MIDRPLNQAKNKNKNRFKGIKDLLIMVFDKADAFSLWIIGFSIAGIGLLIGNTDKIKPLISPNLFHRISISLCVSIIAGIIFRYVYMWFFMLNMKIMDRMISDYSPEEHLPNLTNSKDLDGTQSFEELLIATQQYAGQDLSHFLIDYANADEQQRQILYKTIVDYYVQFTVFNNIDAQRADLFVKSMNELYFRRMPNPPRAGYLRGCSYYLAITLGAPFFLTFILAFIYALILFCFNVHL